MAFVGQWPGEGGASLGMFDEICLHVQIYKKKTHPYVALTTVALRHFVGFSVS
jgi:hypothetical protein